jgi:hypothetical protein
MPWQAQQLRLTAFTQLPVGSMPDPSWWADLTGEAPEIRVNKVREGGIQEEGPYQTGRLQFTLLFTRIDWLFQAQPLQVSSPEEILAMPTIGSLEESLQIFRPIMQRWLQQMAPPVMRLAYGALLMDSVNSKEEGYQRLSEYLPMPLDPTGSSDFLYQINRPRPSLSSIPININRLSKWAVASMRVQPIEPPGRLSRPFLTSCRLELDINTDEGFAQILPHERLTTLFEELTVLGSEIATEGDIP